MNYEPNTKYWKIGDLVIHDADAKTTKMLMIVTGYNAKTGLCKTRYLSSETQREFLRSGQGRLVENEIGYLLDPAKFDINVKAYLMGLLKSLEFTPRQIRTFKRVLGIAD